MQCPDGSGGADPGGENEGVFSFQFSVFSFQFSVFSFQLAVLKSQCAGAILTRMAQGLVYGTEVVCWCVGVCETTSRVFAAGKCSDRDSRPGPTDKSTFDRFRSGFSLDGKTLGFSQNDRLSTDFRKPLKRPSEVLFWYHFCTKICTVENRWGQGKTLKTTVDEIRQTRRIPWVPLTAFPVLTSPSLPNLPVCFVCPTAVGGGGWCGLDWGFRVLLGSPDPARVISCRDFLSIGFSIRLILLPLGTAQGQGRRGGGALCGGRVAGQE